MATGIQQEFLPVIVSSDISELRQDVGFWSHNQVYYNPTDKIIILDHTLTVLGIEQLLNQVIEENIEQTILRYLGKILVNDTNTFAQVCSKNTHGFSKYFSCQHFPDFQGEQFRVQGSGLKGKLRTSPNSQVSWKAIAEWFHQHYPDDAITQKQILVKQIMHAALQKQYVFNSKAAIKSEWSHLLHNDIWLLLNKITHLDELLIALGTIRQFSHTPGTDLSATIIKNKEVFECYKNYDLKTFATSNSVMHQIYNLTTAANLVLVLLARHKKILLPPSWPSLKNPLDLIEPNWKISELANHSSTLLSRILCGSTIKDLSDIPAQVHKFFDNIKSQSVIYNLFYPMLISYEKLHFLTKWPVQNLNKKKAVLHSNNRHHKWSPEWMEQEGYSPEWVQFVRIYWQLNTASDTSKANTVIYLLSWSRLQNFTSPEDIKLTDLRDIHNPDNKNTFYYFCKMLRIKHKSSAWIQSSKIFSDVFNILKLTPDPT